jgi:hypothetical protein
MPRTRVFPFNPGEQSGEGEGDLELPCKEPRPEVVWLVAEKPPRVALPRPVSLDNA